MTVKTLYIEPGSPWENGYLESFNGKLWDGFLNVEVFDTMLDVRVSVARWRRHCSTVRPHSGPNYRPPASEAIQPWPPASAAPQLPAMAAGALGLT
ncbi:MAG: transposase [Armatimonadetes bacterium]|nr:transposase [Armatimonadota bacterium]